MSRPLRWLQRGFVGLALVLMLGHFAVYALYTGALISFPFDYDQGEGFELNDTILLAEGQSPYRPNEIYPFYASNYPPLYHVVLIPFAKLFGPEYWYGRALGALMAVLAAVAIAYAVRRETGHNAAAALAGLAFLASNYVYHIAPLFRQHMSMVALETFAIVALAHAVNISERGRRQRWLLLVMILFLAAGYTKQLAVITVGGAFAWLFLRGVKRALLWGISLAVVAGGIFLLLNLSTEGQWWLNVIAANVNQYILSQYTGLLRQFIGLHGALLLLAGFMLVYELYFSRLSAYSVWFVAALAGSVLAGKWGAGDSYFATAIAAMCILAGIGLGHLLNKGLQWPAWLGLLHKNQALLGVVASALFVAYGLAVVKLPLDVPPFQQIAGTLGIKSNTKFTNFYDSAGWVMGYATIGQMPTSDDTANGWRIVAAIPKDERPILSEEAAFSFRSGKPVVSNPTQLLNLYQNNLYDPSALVAMIEARAFSAVIFRARFYPQPILDAVDANYEIHLVIPMNGYEYTLLLPKRDG
jgi:4-amino-4-deoxy-L-arabinose transferase-like glycosyltransferase